MEIFDGVGTVICRLKYPTLIIAFITIPLDKLDTASQARIRHIQALATVESFDKVSTIICRLKCPPLVSASSTAPLNDRSIVVLRPSRDIHTFTVISRFKHSAEL